MLKINVVAVGKVKEKYFQEAINEYLKRLSRFAEVKVIEVKEENFSKDTLELRKETLKREEENILPHLKGYVIVLAIEGKQFTSEELSKKIDDITISGASEITFVIGGSYGLTEEIKKKADLKFSFSKMTFPHTLARVMLLEQLYRGFMIKVGSTYHK